MISRQDLIRRRRQRRVRTADRLTLPLEQELARTFQHEQYLALTPLSEPIARAIVALRHEVYDINTEHCQTIVAAFQELQLAVQTSIAVLSGPYLSAEMRPYHLIMRLSAFHRILVEAQVLVESVRGQCAYGRLANDPTGAYWHLRMYVRDVVGNYRNLLALLDQEQISISQHYASATA